MKYINSRNTTLPSVSGTWVNYGAGASSKTDNNNCKTETTFGEILLDGSAMRHQVSCEPHAYNAGNYYNFPASSAMNSEPTFNSTCPRGWGLPNNNNKTSYSNFLINYGIDYNATKTQPYDAALLNLPLSFLRSGFYYYDGSLHSQGSDGVYRITSLRLSFHSGNLNPTNGTDAYNGYSVRCVSR